MNDDLVKQAVDELRGLVRCRCNEDYRRVGRQDPNCECDSADAVEVLSNRIEELEAANDAAEKDHDLSSEGNLWRFWSDKARDMATKNVVLKKRIEALEAKLRKSALQELSALGQASEAYQAQLAAEAKLAKAVEALGSIKSMGDGPFNIAAYLIASRCLAELSKERSDEKGQDDG